MKAVELFSGNADITKALNKSGIETISVDYDTKKNADLHANVYGLPTSFFKQFDFIWASPDCTTYSLASHGIHRIRGGYPVSIYAKQCDMCNSIFIKTLIDLDIPFIIENPRSHFRNMPFVKGLHRVTVYYSQYGMPYSKPTDLFSNRPIDSYFDQTRKLTGVQLDYCASYFNFLDRCKMPDRLIDDIVKAVKDILEKEHDKQIV